MKSRNLIESKTKANLHLTFFDPKELASRNAEKKDYLEKQVESIEHLIKELQIELATPLENGRQRNLKPLFNHFNKKLEEIDEKFITFEYLDSVAKNLYLDEIQDEVKRLKNHVSILVNSIHSKPVYSY